MLLAMRGIQGRAKGLEQLGISKVGLSNLSNKINSITYPAADEATAQAEAESPGVIQRSFNAIMTAVEDSRGVVP